MPETTLAAGRELDALVAEKVMGDVAWDVVIEGCSRDGRQCATIADAERHRERLARRYAVGAIVLHDSVPAYSTDIAAAWSVVENLIARGLEPNFGPTPSGGWRVNIYSPKYSTAYGSTAPLAICRAALVALATPEGI